MVNRGSFAFTVEHDRLLAFGFMRTRILKRIIRKGIDDETRPHNHLLGITNTANSNKVDTR